MRPCRPLTRLACSPDAFRFLSSLCERYEAQFGPLPVAGAEPPSAARVVPLLRELCAQFNSRSKTDSIRANVEDVKNTMMSNIEGVLERGERLEDITAKSETLRDQAHTFRQKGRTLRRQMCWANAKWAILLSLVIAVIGFVIFLVACRGFRCVK